MYTSQLTFHEIDTSEASGYVADDSCGAIVSFIGTVRNHNRNKTVRCLEFEAYEPMAIKEIDKILDHAVTYWDLHKAILIHRLGTVEISEKAVVIYVSSVHRKAAFEACSYIIDTLKETVPIWKKEIYDDGHYWISSTP